MNVQDRARSLRASGPSLSGSDAGPIEETKQVSMSDQVERLEPSLLIKPESPEAAVAEEEPFNSVMSSYNGIRGASGGALSDREEEEACSDTEDSVGQEHSRRLSSGRQYLAHRRLGFTPKDNVVEGLHGEDGPSKTSRLQASHMSSSQKVSIQTLMGQIQQHAAGTQGSKAKAPLYKQPVAATSLVQQRRGVGRGVGGSVRANYQHAFSTISHPALRPQPKSKMGAEHAFQKAQRKFPSKGKPKAGGAPLKPAASSLRILSSSALPFGKHSLHLKNSFRPLGSADQSQETSPEATTIPASTVRGGSAVLHPGTKPLGGKPNLRPGAKQRSQHIRKGSRSDDEKASHNATSGASRRPGKAQSLYNHALPIAAEHTPLSGQVSRESPASTSFGPGRFPSELGLMRHLNMHSYAKSDASSLKGARGSASCKHELDQRPKQPMASDHQSDLELDLADAEVASKDRELYVEVMDVNVTDSDVEASEGDSANEALEEEKSNQSSTSMLYSMNLLHKSNPLLGNYSKVGVRSTYASRPGVRPDRTSKVPQTKPAVSFFEQTLGAKHAGRRTPKSRKYGLSQNTMVTQLKMPTLGLKFVSVNLFSSKLTTIDLSQNLLKTLPEELSDIHPLEHLKLDHNQLTRLPSQLWKLANLKSIIASNNCLQALPENFEWLVNLECLQLNEN